MKDESYIGQDRREEKVFAYKSVQAHRIFLAALSIQRYDNLLIYRPELTSDHTINSVFSVRILPGPPVNVLVALNYSRSLIHKYRVIETFFLSSSNFPVLQSGPATDSALQMTLSSGIGPFVYCVYHFLLPQEPAVLTSQEPQTLCSNPEREYSELLILFRLFSFAGLNIFIQQCSCFTS